MASITYWNRIEPRPRSADLGPTLAARIRDPLWMLTRQWQFGEFQGEDAASPAWVHFGGTLSPIIGWATSGGPSASYSASRPLDSEIEREPFTPDLTIRVELGQVFEDLLTDHGAGGLATAFRRDYPIANASEADLAADPDRSGARFLRVVMGRAIDGAAVYRAAAASLPGLPAAPAEISTGDPTPVRAALTELVDWVRAVYGDLAQRDAPSWKPQRLEYEAVSTARVADDQSTTLRVVPGRSGALDWTNFDSVAGSLGSVEAGIRPVQRFGHSLLPIQVRFRGMPNARWWDFENASIDLGRLTPDRRDLAKLVVMDFMLVHGNDWFVAPFEMEKGNLCRIESVIVHDVFGGATSIPRADRSTALPGSPVTERWTLFSTTVDGAAAGDPPIADFFVLAPSSPPAYQVGAALEDVRFVRDEMANMVWALEQTTEGESGRPLLGPERDPARNGGSPSSTRPAEGAPPLRYLIQTDVPDYWIPFIPVAVDPARGSIALERAAMLRPDPAGGPAAPILPRGRILTPSSIPPGQRYQVFEEEVTRSGVRVLRVPVRSRWFDGSTHLWIARKKLAGRGEGSSGLRFDLAT